MKSDTIMLNDLLSLQNTKFTIPVYQRPYSWKKEQCKRFVNDIEEMILKKSSNHFIGTVIYIANDVVATATETKEFMIIDGQQRITTATLFIKAIYDLMKESKEKTLLFENTLVIDRFDKKPKLVPIGSDATALKYLIKNSVNEIEKSKSSIIENYKFIKKMITSSKILSVEEFFKGFKKLSIVEIILEREKDNPQVIFESINATGLDLKESDLIRNFILMDKTLNEQKKLYDKYWSKIEENILNDNISSFIKDFLTIKLNRIPKENDVFKEFKLFFKKGEERGDFNLEKLLKELLKYSEIYKKIIFGDGSDIEENGLKDIRLLGYKVVYPVILQLYKEYEDKKFSQEIFLNILKLLESFLVRRFVTNKKSSEQNSIFAMILKSTKRNSSFDYNSYHHFIGYSLLKYFPDDDEFKEFLFTKNLYSQKTKFTKYFLGKIENSGKEKTVLDEKIQIEHIMPQKLTPQWRSDLGIEADIIHSMYLHTLGNLTLTGYNQKYKNKPFKEKVKLVQQFSSLNLNRTFIDFERWTAEEIKERAKNLIEKSLKIWTYPEIDYNIVPKIVKNSNEYTLGDEIVVKNQKPKHFIFLDEKVKISNWRDFFIEFLQICLNLDFDKFQTLTKDPDLNLKKYRVISDKKEDIGEDEHYELHENIFVKRSGDARTILKYTKIIFEKFEFIDDDFVFGLEE